MDVAIHVRAGALARWVGWLAEALARRPDTRVRLVIVEGEPDDASALVTLFSLERLLLRHNRDGGADRIGRDTVARFLTTPADFSLGLVIDLSEAGVASTSASPVLRPLFSGHPGETALASALFFQGTPRIDIERVEPGGQGRRIVATGAASLEDAAGIGGGIEAVGSRVIALLLKAIDGPAEVSLGQSPTAVRPIGRSDVLRYGAKSVARQAVRAAYQLCCHPSHWRVGWRFVQPGHDVWSRRDLAGVRWNVLPDPVDHFYADPFPLRWQGRDYLFFEDLSYRTGKGVISVVVFNEAGRPGPTMPALEEPFHLSYPFLIEHGGQVWMIPETSAHRDIAIYRAVDFPHRWERHTVLVQNVEAADATVTQHDGRWWMFAVTRDGIGGYSDTLSIWYADDLFGPWTPHPANPLLVDDRVARPAGWMVHRDGALFRPAQDCRGAYGAAINLMRVTRLDPQGFEQSEETHLVPNTNWPGRRLHTLNYNGRLETLDGFVIRPKLKPFADMVDRKFAPR